MRIRPTSAERLVLLLIAGIAVFAYDAHARHSGERDGLAEADIRTGKLQWQLGGKPQAWQPALKELFHERYRVEAKRAFACCPTEYESCYARAYNERVARHLVTMSPEFSIERTFEEARLEWEAAARN